MWAGLGVTFRIFFAVIRRVSTLTHLLLSFHILSLLWHWGLNLCEPSRPGKRSASHVYIQPWIFMPMRSYDYFLESGCAWTSVFRPPPHSPVSCRCHLFSSLCCFLCQLSVLFSTARLPSSEAPPVHVPSAFGKVVICYAFSSVSGLVQHTSTKIILCCAEWLECWSGFLLAIYLPI